MTHASDYGESELRERTRKMRRWLGERRDARVYFDNDAPGAAPLNALQVLALVDSGRTPK